MLVDIALMSDINPEETEDKPQETPITPKPKNKGGRPPKNYKLPPIQPIVFDESNLDWGSGDGIDQRSRSSFASAHAMLTKQKQQFESVTDSFYFAMCEKTKEGRELSKSELDTFEKYSQRLRQISDDLKSLGRDRLEEQKIQASLALQAENRVTQINITIVPPPAPVETPYKATDYIIEDKHEAEPEASEDTAEPEV